MRLTHRHHPAHAARPAPDRLARRQRRRVLLLVTAVLVLGLAAPGSSSPRNQAGAATSTGDMDTTADGTEARLDELEQRLTEVERRLAVLDGGPTTPAASATPSASPSATVSASPSAGPSASPSASASAGPSASASTSTSPTATSSTGAGASTGDVPTLLTTGVPVGWTPARTVQGTYTVTTPGAVVEDLRVVGDIVVAAPDVTLRRVDVVGGQIENYAGRTCSSGLTVEDSTVRRGSQPTTDDDGPSLGTGGYTATNVLLDGRPEGFRVGGAGACGPVTITDSYARAVAPDQCTDWHGDALQGYDGDALTLTNTVLVLAERDDCHGTAPFFYPADQGNTSADVDGLVVSGGGYPFRLGTAGSVSGLQVVDWIFGPVDVNCDALDRFDATVVTLDVLGQPVLGRQVRCTGDGT